MVPLLFSQASTTNHPLIFTVAPPLQAHTPRLKPYLLRRPRFLVRSISRNSNQSRRELRGREPPRTVFPGGYKRPEIRVPCLVLQLDADDVLAEDDDALGVVDRAVSKWAGIVVLNGGEATGGRIYEAACKLKSVVRDRAYLLVAERVDIAAAANASGVVLSDQGLPAVVARSTMMDSKSNSVVLPLVARNVQTADAALNASSSEGADFLIYSLGKEKHVDVVLNSVCENVKIPIFVMFTYGEETLVVEASKLLESGASGLVTSVKGFRKFSDDALNNLFSNVYTLNKTTKDEFANSNQNKLLNSENGIGAEARFAGFINLEDRKKQLIEREKLVLLEAINVIQKAAPLMEEVSLLADAVSQIDEPFLLAIVGEFNSGKSSVINALLGSKHLKEGVVPTTNEITFLRYSKLNSGEAQRCERHPDGQYICYLPAPILKECFALIHISP